MCVCVCVFILFNTVLDVCALNALKMQIFIYAPIPSHTQQYLSIIYIFSYVHIIFKYII